MAKGYNLEQTGPQVQEAINKSLNLTTATQSKEGLMSAQDKQKLDSLDSELAGKVDKVPGKGLSTNDYDNTEKGKVASAYQKPVGGIPASDLAEGVIPDTSQFITKTVNDLANYYLKTETYSRSETYNKTEVDALIALIKQFTYQVVSELPEASESTMYKLYLVPSADPQTQNVKDEYITVRSGSEGAYTYAWEQIGSTAIDLSGYVTTQALNAALANYTTTANLTTLLAAKQDVIADLSTIRSGAAAGATAYQKPGTGIPKTDLESGVQQSLDLADSAIQAEPTGVDVPVEPSLYATKEEVDELEAKLGTSETVNGMQLGTEGTGRINADGSRTWNNSYKYRDIPNNGYTRVTGHGSTYKNLIYLAFYNSATPGSSSLISSLTAGTSSVDINFDELVPPGTVTITVGWSLTSPATTAAITLYKIVDRLDNIEDRLDALEDVTEDLPDLEETVDDLLTKTHFVTKTEDDFTLAGYYNSENTNLTDQYHYVSLPLINVQEGQKIYWHGWATGESFKTSQAICCYDNDNLPYNGTDARIDFNELNTIDYVSGEFSFIVPTNCSQVGISFTFYSYPVPDGAYIQIGDNKYTLTDAGAELVNSAIGMNEETGDKSANYFLKGNSNIVVSPSKKLGIIAAGQSNIAGRNSYSDLPSGFVNPNSKVKFCDNTNGTFSAFEVTDGGAGNDWSFDAIVYDYLTKSAYGNQSEIYVMKKAMGGTSIDKDGATSYHWTADYEYLANESASLLRAFESIVRKGEETNGTNFEIRAFLWHQGEGDADTQAVANRYYDNLKNMLAYVRGVVGNPRLDFFCGNLSTHNVSNPYVSVINAAYAKLASEDPYFHCVDMRNATLEDSWHFDYEWSIYFGQMVYDMMIDAGIISGTKINPSEPS